MIQKDTSQDESVIIHNMVWPERIIWIIVILIFYVFVIYQSVENQKRTKDIYDQNDEISDLKLDNVLLRGEVKFYKDSDSSNHEFYNKLFNSILQKRFP